LSNSATLQTWLENIEQMHPQEIELGLERVRRVAQKLSLRLDRIKTVVVAGTNGKGSTVAALQAIALKHGLSVGSYTSPHLLQFNERIVLDGKPVSDAVLCHAFEQVERARGSIPLTYFEFTTLAALYCFDQFSPHICLLEVGLGGRLDAVNIVDADITLVTNIQLDHEAWLGPDRASIAREKAGIFRAGVPAICAENEPPANLSQLALEAGAGWLQLGSDFSLEQRQGDWHWQGHDAGGQAVAIDGEGQLLLHADAVAAAIQAAMLLLPLPQPQLVALALASLTLPGRCQWLQTAQGTMLLDVAHNPAAACRLVQVLEQNKTGGKTHAIFAMLADKRADRFIGHLAPVIDGHWWLPLLQTARAKPPRLLLNSGVPGPSRLMDSTEQALELALATMNRDDRLIVTGSFYTVAEAMQALAKRGVNFE
jgi:dihydrofolate synthase/folylpolyglutamate synthase